MRRKESFSGFYHVFNRSIRTSKLFIEYSDYVRFIATILCMQFGNKLPKEVTISQITKLLIKGIPINNCYEMFNGHDRNIEICVFCLMKTHPHLVLRVFNKHNLAQFLKRVHHSYTMYYNIKYGFTGHLMENTMKTKPINSLYQLKNCLNYIHKNPYIYPEWSGREEEYPFSTYSDYISNNRWGRFVTIINFDNYNNKTTRK